jgi:hypothetical protein
MCRRALLERLIRQSGVISALLLLLLTASCRFPYGFAGGGLDASLRTFALVPIQNPTTTPGLERELGELLAADMKRLRLREVPESQAHVLVTGKIIKYDVDIPVAFSADRRTASGTRRRLEVTVEIEMTEVASGKVILKRSISQSGEYAESAEATGRREAFTRIVNDVIAGVQSQW